MTQRLSIRETTAVSRIGTRLGRHVTTAFIDSLNHHLGFCRLEASNKAKKICEILTAILEDGRSRHRATEVIGTIVTEAHHRTLAGNTDMTQDDATALLDAIKALGIPAGELAKPHWRVGLKPSAVTLPEPSRSEVSASPASFATHPRIHLEALDYIQQLAGDDTRPQHRGRELEMILANVLTIEGLCGARNVVNPGEQIDVTFELDFQHYLLESRWTKDAQGMHELREFSEKVRRKAEGTFGVFVSMSGFAGSINANAAQGARLNCIGLTGRELILVLEGRTTFGAVVRAGRQVASSRSLFYAELHGAAG